MEKEIIEVVNKCYKENIIDILKNIYSSLNKYMKVRLITKYKFKTSWYGEIL